MQQTISKHPVQMNVTPIYLSRHDSPAREESRMSKGSPCCFSSLGMNRTNATPSKIKRGSVQAMTETFISGSENTIDSSPTSAKVLDLTCLKKSLAEHRMINPKTTAFRHLAAPRGSMPTKPRIASNVGNNGGKDT